MATYRSKPVEKEAFKFELGPMKEEWPDWFHAARQAGDVEIGVGKCFIKTLEGTMEANQGDYVIRGLAGEIYPCKPDIFQASYEAVEDDDPGDDPDLVILDHINLLLHAMRRAKPDDRSPRDRHWAIAITDTERILAWWLYACVDADNTEQIIRKAAES